MDLANRAYMRACPPYHHVDANKEDAIFDQASIGGAILANPIFAGLSLTSPSRWLRHPSKISEPRSSVILFIEDPSGALAQTVLNTPIYVWLSIQSQASVTCSPTTTTP
ncbi:hypothetical protein RSOLAG1IB_06286 [Rhizoctonia solani AG-1 IB]|uniref:Uncharacterized protein n=1 Tax=Thanatephorus cucumeris (strain AG1-IB / isolate 7/3/14) TaxID=1108050 RepID=A0A0B7F8T3_THACB|nr:hypothetical protein RSOLAG1IB_06286 [Rhizoctonia solani AG-1 IB]